jgi:hypothetical protein
MKLILGSMHVDKSEMGGGGDKEMGIWQREQHCRSTSIQCTLDSHVRQKEL